MNARPRSHPVLRSSPSPWRSFGTSTWLASSRGPRGYWVDPMRGAQHGQVGGPLSPPSPPTGLAGVASRQEGLPTLAEVEWWDYRVEEGCPLVVAAGLWQEATGLR